MKTNPTRQILIVAIIIIIKQPRRKLELQSYSYDLQVKLLEQASYEVIWCCLDASYCCLRCFQG